MSLLCLVVAQNDRSITYIEKLVVACLLVFWPCLQYNVVFGAFSWPRRRTLLSYYFTTTATDACFGTGYISLSLTACLVSFIAGSPIKTSATTFTTTTTTKRRRTWRVETSTTFGCLAELRLQSIQQQEQQQQQQQPYPLFGPRFRRHILVDTGIARSSRPSLGRNAQTTHYARRRRRLRHFVSQI